MIPLSLYIHVPWCIKKCPYCDFNSHKSPEHIPEEAYIHALIEDLKADLNLCSPRIIHSIFIGGGTPSILSAKAYELLFTELKKLLVFADDIEITLEANPGTTDEARFTEYRQLGINRLSLGIQSFSVEHLKILGRIHDSHQAHHAIETAMKAGFTRLNLDLMHSLPNQTIEQGLLDLQTAINYQPEHISWYQLTIEPNTIFYKTKPQLPAVDDTYHLEEQGFSKLKKAGYERYEISAFSKHQKQARHNVNYWLFGDYLGIGAGAHGKITKNGVVLRTQKHRQPKDYLDKNKPFMAQLNTVAKDELIFEYMLNTTRLEQAIPLTLFCERTGMPIEDLLHKLKQAQAKNLVILNESSWQVTPHGRCFTNDLQALFLS